MEDFIKTLVYSIIDAIEEFFNALIVPSTRFTFDAFLVSLVFLIWSVISEFTGLPSAVSWMEALTCSILMGIIVLIDSSARSKIKSNIGLLKQYSSRFVYTGEEEEAEEIQEEVSEDE